MIKENTIVRDNRFKETHRVIRVDRGNNGKLYATVRNISGPGSYQGIETFEISELKEIKKEKQSGRRK